MSPRMLTINPEDVRLSTAEDGRRSAWLDQIVEFVQQAAEEGDTVTLTVKRRMMTPVEVADTIGVSRSTISRKIKAGDLRVAKVGNRNRIPYEEFERFWRQTMGDLAAPLQGPGHSVLRPDDVGDGRGRVTNG